MIIHCNHVDAYRLIWNNADNVQRFSGFDNNDVHSHHLNDSNNDDNNGDNNFLYW